jgi:hypothetical protein
MVVKIIKGKDPRKWFATFDSLTIHLKMFLGKSTQGWVCPKYDIPSYPIFDYIKICHLRIFYIIIGYFRLFIISYYKQHFFQHKDGCGWIIW